jgi:tetratricopeptide (TPR) repeat protein
MKRFSTVEKTVALSVIALAIVLRVVYLWQYSSSPLFNVPIGPDIQEYDIWAREIIANGLIWSKLHIHAPAYPIFLAFLYKISSFSLLFVRSVQLGLGILGILLCAWTVRRFARSESAAGNTVSLLFMAFALLYPPLIYYNSELISESLMLPLLCLTITLLYWGESCLFNEKNENKGIGLLAGSGLAAGLAVIAHPMTLLFVAIETVFLFSMHSLNLKRPKMRLSWKRKLVPLFFLLPVIFAVLPVCLHNSRLAGSFVLIQKNSGFNFFLGNNPDATGTCYLRPGRAWVKFHEHAEKAAVAKNISKDSYLTGQAIDFMLRNPGKEINLLFSKMLYVWNRQELVSGADVAPLLYWTQLMHWTKYAFVILGILAITGLILCLFDKVILCSYRHFLLLTVAFWLAQIITVTSGRYRVAMYPALFLFAAFAVYELRKAITNPIYGGRIAAALGLGAIVVLLPTPYVDSLRETSEANSLLGEACFHAGSFEEAEVYLTKSFKRSNDLARCFNLLGIIAEKKSPAQSEAMFKKAISVAPDEAEGYMNLAIIASKKGELEKAERLFKTALENGSDRAEVLYNYGFFAQKTGRPELAERYYRLCLERNQGYRKALNSLGVLMIQLKKPAKAVEYLRKASALEPANNKVKLNLAVAQYLSGNRDQAIKTLNAIIAADPDNINAKNLRSRFKK